MAHTENDTTFIEYALQLADIGKGFYARGWVLGTSGNFSVVISRDPLQLAITASGNDKGNLTPEQILLIDGNGTVIAGNGKPSDETVKHSGAVGVGPGIGNAERDQFDGAKRQREGSCGLPSPP